MGMDIGDEVIWRESVAPTRSYKAYRITKGVIVGKRAGKKGNDFEIAVRWYSGSMPRHPSAFIWVPAQTVLFGRTDDRMVSVKITPLALAKRLAREKSDGPTSPTVIRKAA